MNKVNLTNTFKPIISYFTSSRLMNHMVKSYNLNKDKRVKDITYIEFTPSIVLDKDISDELIDILSEKELHRELEKFTNVLLSNFDKDDLITFYNNIESLEINETDLDDFNTRINKTNAKTLAYYHAKNNVINISSKDNTDTIYHELFHMSTSKKDNNLVFNGFSQANIITKETIGIGINEGYTQLLTERYFNDECSKGNYSYFVYICDLLERIVGKSKMEKLYLNSNLYGLVEELKNYAFDEDITCFISYLDFLIKHMYDKKISKKTLEFIRNIGIFINKFIIMTYINKQKVIDYSDEEFPNFVEETNYFLSHSILLLNLNDKQVNVSMLEDDMFVSKITNELDQLGIDFSVNTL